MSLSIFLSRKKTKKRVASDDVDSSESNGVEPKPLVDYKVETPEVKPNVELVTNKYGRGLGFSAEDGNNTPYAPRHRATYPVSFVKGETVTNKLPELIPKVSKGEQSAGENNTNANSNNSSTKADRLSPAPAFPAPALPQSKESVKSDSDPEENEQDEQDETAQGAQLPTFQAASAEPTAPPCNGKQREGSTAPKSDSDMELEDFDPDDIDRQLELALEKKVEFCCMAFVFDEVSEV